MRFSVLRANGRYLARGCAVVMLAGAAAGCSSQVARFNGGIDDTATASTPNQRAIILKQNVDQPFPGDTMAQPAPVDPGYTRSVSRTSLEPVQVQALPPVAQAQPVTTPGERPAAAAAKPYVDRTISTGTVTPVKEHLAAKPFRQASPDADRTASASSSFKGWSAVGGTAITVKNGETVGGLSARYGVPSKVLMETNGLASAAALKSGQRIIIPVYSGAAKTAEAAAPAAKVAQAKPEQTRTDAPAGRIPLPSTAPDQRVAVVPQQPRLKEKKSEAVADASAREPKLQPKAADAAKAEPRKMASTDAGTYTVRKGDTLAAIARRNGVSTAAIKHENGMKDGLLRVGQTLKMPGKGATVVAQSDAPRQVDPVKTGSTPPDAGQPRAALTAYAPPKQDAKVIQQAEQSKAEAPDSTGIGKMRWPVRGRVIQAFGAGDDGIDISVPQGTPVKAAENGVVIYAGDGLKEFGNTVLVRHENGLVTVYGHASSIEVSRGQKVKRGQEIALSGMSGQADSPKLHFEVRKNSAPVNPSGYLE